MKNKGFTLVELLAVITILAVIFVIATVSISTVIKKSKEKAKFIAASDIVDIASAYFETESVSKENGTCVKIQDLINKGYLEKDATNPATGENGDFSDSDMICINSGSTKQDDYKSHDGQYSFDGFYYKLGSISTTSAKKGDVNLDGKITAIDARKVLQLAEKPNEYLMGDVNLDGEITREDSELLLKIAAGTVSSTDVQRQLSDLNGDGKITAIDARYVLQIVAGIRVQ